MTGQRVLAAAAGDVDGDGRQDLALLSFNDSGAREATARKTSMSFSQPHQLASRAQVAEITCLCVSDLRGRGFVSQIGRALRVFG